MSVSSITGSSSFDYLTQSVQKSNQTETQYSSSSIGEAATLELSSTAATSAVAQGSGAPTSSSSCPLGSNVCMGCGSCSKTSKTSESYSLTQSNTDTQESANTNYLTTAATNAYEMNTKFL
ncbi:hypothetical protein [Sporomusa malonica]|uniref:Uncharacterized protein n=1 Tax=Sporomusa malonica TaxID=112901 RepID=A0A1W2BGD4_9FIRM|nr:hypothetical protein [Sporomusa malonica]SMC71891.1 hypothetical protein SAMN04488500_107160 [Sporomusa malonica]